MMTDRAGRLVPLASGFPEDDEALMIRADARLLGATLLKGQAIRYPLAGRQAYLVPTTGSVTVNGTILAPGDGAAARQEDELRIQALSEIVLVDVD
jgi:redox-sensitive bicupin YhaK (pirin superfamily)